MASQPTIDGDGRPLPTFGFLNAHDAFRRDLPRFTGAAERLATGTLADDGLANLRLHWSVYRTYLEEHHGVEDAVLFPAVTEVEPALKAVVEDLAAQHDALHELLPRIDDLLGRDDPPAAELAAAFSSLRELLEPHLATEEAELVPVILTAMVEGRVTPPPRGEGPAAHAPVPDEVGIPFTVEHLDDDLRSTALAFFPQQLDPDAVDEWLAAHRQRLATWAG